MRKFGVLFVLIVAVAIVSPPHMQANALINVEFAKNIDEVVVIPVLVTSYRMDAEGNQSPANFALDPDLDKWLFEKVDDFYKGYTARGLGDEWLAMKVEQTQANEAMSAEVGATTGIESVVKGVEYADSATQAEKAVRERAAQLIAEYNEGTGGDVDGYVIFTAQARTMETISGEQTYWTIGFEVVDTKVTEIASVISFYGSHNGADPRPGFEKLFGTMDKKFKKKGLVRGKEPQADAVDISDL